ncbi:hypothetical protein D3C72_2019070 [compost metagenome]
MRNINQSFCPLTKIFSVQVSRSKFRNNVMNMTSGCHNASTLFQKRNDSRNTFFCSGRQSHNWFSTFAQRRATHKIHLSTNTTELISPDGICTNLSCQIDFYRRIDGVHFLVLHNVNRKIHVLNIHKSNGRIIIYKVV